MSTTINEALVGAAERLESEVSLTPALSIISDMADIADSRMILENCVEQLTMADGSVVDVLEAEQTYRDWRASHADSIKGGAQTGVPLASEIKATMEMLNNPSMESDLIQAMKRTFHSMSVTLKTFGKDLVDIRSQISSNKSTITANPVMLDSVSAYNFLTRANKPVRGMDTAIDEDIRFIEEGQTHYKRLFEVSTDLAKRFREACNSDSEDSIRETIDYFDDNLMDRTQFENLTSFNLLGNRTVFLDKRGFPQFKKNPTGWKFSNLSGLKELLVKKKIHGFSIGGPIKSISGVPGVNNVAAKRVVTMQIKATGGETSIEGFMKTLDKAISLNNQTVKFAQMAAAMGERIQRLSADMDDAYNHVNTEKTTEQNIIRLRELRALHRSARRSVSQYMFMGKAIATMMEDHASYVYRNITLIANDVLKKSTEKETEQ